MDNVKTDEYYLQQIFVYCGFIIENANTYTDTQICEDRNLFNSILLDISNIGEAVNHLSSSFRKQHSEIPWSRIITLRNIIVHDYGDVDLQIIVDTIHRDIPKLQSWVDNLLQSK
ncbi:MAG: DUF86 domain-containing protein [Coprobacillus sp.]|nr:DUF86 domain-containing protein [Coprobacillus sp.]